MYKKFKNIPDYKHWKIINEINKGWSKDKKYYVEDYKGNRYLLRISDKKYLHKKKREFEIIKKYNELSFEMSKAVSFGVCNDFIYMILTWVDGKPLANTITKLTHKEQYELRIQGGKILQLIHSVDVDKRDIPINNGQERKLEKLIKYENSSVRVDNDSIALDYVRKNIHKINLLPPVYKHGDFHVGNLILTPNNTLGVIDFNRWDCGDRYEEFYKVQSFDVEVSIPFSVGQIHGYFNGEPPRSFWEVLAVYVAYSSLHSIRWAEKFGEEDVADMQLRFIKTMEHYNNFQKIIPSWYKEENN